MFRLSSVLSAGLLVLFLALSNSTVVFGADGSVPVVVGGEEELDACAGIGVVSGLNPKGDGFLSVRSGPDVSYSEQDELREAAEVYICGASKDKRWLGIVYSNSKSVSIYDCGVSSPVSPARPYRGKCRSGWVRAKWIKGVAG